jgi:dihydrofolate synthase / folylpolyglutamate synthase
MHFKDAESFLLQREMFGWKLGLERMTRFLDELGQPQRQFACVHVAGTNGKGSVSAMLASILQESGQSCGMYTSPHLQSLRERIRVNGSSVTESAVAALVARWRPLIEELQCTFFETMTGLAFCHFADAGINIAVVEVGLGGRLDATNVITPLLSIITNISFDHVDHLGSTLAAIAAEKAGIIKSGIPCVIGSLPAEAEKVVHEKAALLSSPVLAARHAVGVHGLKMTASGSSFTARSAAFDYNELFLPLPGPHQIGNSCVAICAAELLGRQGVIPLPPPLRQGLARVDWAGRFERILSSPLVISDVAHNVGGFQQQNWMWRRFYHDRRKGLVLGLVKDKDLEHVIQELPADAEMIFAVPAPTHRTLPAEELTAALERANFPVTACSSVMDGVRRALAWAAGDENKMVCITGSHYVVGEALSGIKSLTK